MTVTSESMRTRPHAAAASAVAHANRAAGQAAAVAEMVRKGHPLNGIVQQLLAAQGSLDALLVRLVQDELDRQIPTDELHPDVRCLLGPVLRRSRGQSSRPRTQRRSAMTPPGDQHQGTRS